MLHLETKTTNCRKQRALVFRHDDFKGIELYPVERYSWIETEGHSDHFFKEGGQEEPANVGGVEGETLPPEIPELIVGILGHYNLESMNVEHICNYMETDDDNQPLVENLRDVSNNDGVCTNEWGHNNICHRK
uniref:Uncharacterized protein n=1 Tax=Corethron hystrix TaxID=216773 RepID=A0A7S1BA30_9STRA|mmetsp:Transcript_18998/g.43272  ORF Transcript_18998/g.43272 Transcript_18998/m.43272 type:complete len:133 (+) Transcript_18998:156-554(+)